jgi:hypothetical protein
MSRSLRWWLINGIGGAAVLFGSFFATLALIDGNAGSIVDEARRGAAVRIKLDPRSCASLGSLSCETPYEGHYNSATNSWTITGRSRDSDKILTTSYTNAPNEPGGISIWGMVAKFDRAGKLMLGNAVIGSVELAERKSWLSRLFQ